MIGLVLGRRMSHQTASNFRLFRSVLSEKAISLRIKVQTPPPCRSRSRLMILYPSSSISEFVTVPSNQVSDTPMMAALV